ncbi:MAG: YdbL family protein [Xanthomonadales bacterium]|nr:YdbL family protein [Xanthomonadales bacterium]
MRKAIWLTAAGSALLLAACVTINVYFPAAAAERAAEEFVGKVIGEEAPPPKAGEPEARSRRGPGALLLDLLVAPAHARPDLEVRTPQIQAIQERMAERFQKVLRPHFDSGALGFTRDGLVELIDPALVPLRERAALRQAVAEDNRDRDAVYREIAVANGHPEWEPEIRAIFARQWIEQARPGWHYQDAEGRWQRK